MNYLWEVALRTDDMEVPRENLRYVPAKSYSPYIEVSFEDLNTIVLEENIIEANPLYRFSSIFGALLDINLVQYSELRTMLFDIYMQYMIQIDLRQGLSKDEYYLRFILRDIMNGVYGDDIKSAVLILTPKQLRRVLCCMLNLYRCGTSILLFRRVMRTMYPDSLVYSSNDIFREILIYIGVKETPQERSKIDFLIAFFLPLDYMTHLFWEYHFGIIDVEVTMELDNMILF